MQPVAWGCLNMRRLQAVRVCVSVFIAICVAIFNLAHQLRQHALAATCSRLMSVSLCVHVCVCMCVCVSGRHVKSTRCVFEIKAAVYRAALFAFNASNCLALRNLGLPIRRVVCANYDSTICHSSSTANADAATQSINQSIFINCRPPHAACHMPLAT